MKTNVSVSSKIKILGALLLATIFLVIFVSIYLNQKNIKDASVVNIAGKQRMLTQKISKNIYFLYQNRNESFVQMDKAVEEFKYNLSTLKNGNELLNIQKAPTEVIKSQISKVELLWKGFEKNVSSFKNAILNGNIEQLNQSLKYITETNNSLLENVDKVVSLYEAHIEEKNTFIKNFQYLAFAALIVLGIYALIQLRQIEAHAKEFIEKYKQIKDADIHNIEPINMETQKEKEFVEMADSMNCFLTKVSSAMQYSNSALEQSKMASEKLQDLTDEFEDIIDDLENKSEVLKEIDKSEDIAIESSENLLRTTKKLNDLKNQLDSLLKNCQEK